MYFYRQAEGMNSEPTVFVVDADGAIRDAVRTLVHTMNLQCEGYASGREFLEEYGPDRAGCLVLEIRIPDINGVQIQERLAAEEASLPIIFLTNQATVSIAVRAMRCGAVHVIEKPFREHELWDAIQEAIELDRSQRESARHRQALQERMEQLSEKERELLKLVAEGKAKEAMAEELGVCVRTVELRRTQLMRKLEFTAPIELIHFALAASDGHAHQDRDAYCS